MKKSQCGGNVWNRNLIKLELGLKFLFVVLLSICFSPSVFSFRRNYIPTENDLKEAVLHSKSFITTEKKPYLSGLRVESDKPFGEEFLGYTPRGVSIVFPNTLVRVVLFGWWMEEIDLVGFTSGPDCNSVVVNVTQADFFVQTEKRVIFQYNFPPLKGKEDVYWFCWKQRNHQNENGDEIKLPYLLVNDLQSAVSTSLPERQYYFPLPIQISIIIVCLVLSALFSGLNLGLMTLTPQELMLISKSGSPKERKYAEVVLPIRMTGTQLLCSLLLGNVCVNSAISILFEDIASGYLALAISSAGIAACVKKGLEVGARTIYLTKFFMWLTFPLAYPIGKILDKIAGFEVVSYDRRRLMEMIKMTTRYEEGLDEELKIAVGAMEISDKTVGEVMTRIDDVFMLPDTTVLNTKTVTEVIRMGYNRIPVYSGDRNNVSALLFVKDLALLNPDDSFTIKTVCSYHEHALRFVMEDTPLRVMLEEFKKGDYHLAMVQRVVQNDGLDPSYELVGLVTLEDIVEEILQAEIVDETDVILDNVNKTRRRRAIMHTSFFTDTDPETCIISIQMQVVTMQWLSTNHKVFSDCFIEKNILERVVRQNVHKIELFHVKDASNTIPSHARLYHNKTPSDKFILILEGRATVTIGETNMTFQAGPWHCFGKELLDVILDDINKSRLAEECPASPKILAAETKRLTFVPDYTVVIKDHCTYLEITPETYSLAFKTTLITRNRDKFEQKNPIEEQPGKVHKTTSEGELKTNNASLPTSPSSALRKCRTGGGKPGLLSGKSFDFS
ncbi:unnamed protein product [Bursaphelenchus xylophilus]|uniref:(pine wood nematode) hypothetical protein n=1 Tax=Bursaphelenchus xylophilus TaxID=6326 RepID=A0A7I8X5H6_BURXY|nr:unnamed protein product [Bursaphelenchus xylophilus]CAG9129081.1 unnamed protein product [Bursaphelenchus xylophilus]